MSYFGDLKDYHSVIMNKIIETISEIAIKAGEQIMVIYNDESKFAQVDFKSDSSPLTLADKASNDIIVEALQSQFPEIPVLSEEGKHLPYEERSSWSKFWLVDPLDGTKEFIKRNGEFTVNIALIEDHYPTLGVIYTPATQTLYVGNASEGLCQKKVADGKAIDLKVNNRANDRIAVGSRSHASEEEAELLKEYGVINSISIGSSLKFCQVADGAADIYYRHGPTMEWDTAAGQAIVEAAGGSVLLKKDMTRFRYNKEDLLNTSFLVKGFS